MKKICIAVLGLITMASCSKSFLDKSPTDKKTIENFYKTPEDAMEGLTAAYDGLQYGDYDNITLVSEIASDNCFGGGGESDLPWKRWDRVENDINLNEGLWSRYYVGIYRANILLAHLDDINWGADSTLKVRYRAEARFLRAYFYFDLVRVFGNVPLVTQPLQPSELYMKQSPAEDVYKFIVDDLKAAATDLQPTAYNAIPTTEYGRVTKWAAEALLGRVFLYYTGYYQKPDVGGSLTKADARSYIDDVIHASGYALLDSFPRLWQSAGASFAGEDNKETVFAIKFTYKGLGDWNKHDGNRMQVDIGIRNAVDPPYYKGWGAGTVNPKLWASYESGDMRRAATIISINDEHLGVPTPFPQYTGYFWKKYAMMYADRPDQPSIGGDFQIDNYYDFIAIRFADVLLMGAELNLDADLGKAQGYYDLVRDRAFGNHDHAHPLTNDDAGLQLIFTERNEELALEGLRYWDLLRQGMTKAKAAIDNPSLSDEQFKVVFRPETNGLLQIPQQEIAVSNNALTQNVGWSN